MALPRLLAGPIVRRTDPRSVAVWVALREPGTVRIHVWEGRQKSDGVGRVASGDAALATGGVLTHRLGEHLHVALVCTALDFLLPAQFRPIVPPLRPGALYSYDISFTPEASSETVGLRDLGLLDEDPGGDPNARRIEGVSQDAPRHLALGYAKDWLPGFATSPATLGDIRIAQASCRKVHGPGTDALSWLDKLIEQKLLAPLERIQQLFLSGDQIYADDVPTCLLPVIHDLAVEVMGGEEELPLDEQRQALLTLESAPPMRRTVLVRTQAGFTSVEAQNHILTFGEYAALYLLAWSPRVWRAIADEARCYQHAEAQSPFTLTDLKKLFVGENEVAPAGEAFRERVKEKNASAFKEERQKVIVFASTVAKVARVLANTPTYMIFDDHDVTDDWNINATWRNRVLTRPLGCAVVRNALLAYVFFQGWGSDWRSHDDVREEGEPDLQEPRPNKRMLAAGEAYLQTLVGRPQDKANELDQLFGLKAGGAERAIFHYEAAGSLYQVRVLDSRTRRSFPFSAGVAPAFLLGREPVSTLDAQLPKGPRRAGTEFLLVVASTPVLGPELLERMLVPAVMQGFDAYRAFAGEESDFEPQGAAGEHDTSMSLATARTRGALFIDTETWPSNEVAQHELLNRMASYERVIVLGGDVHYGTNISMDWYFFDRNLGESSRKSARIVQLTSSASRNALEKRVEALYYGYHWMNQWMFGSTFDGFAWKDGARLTLPAGATLPLLRHSRMKEKPSLLPAYGWPEGTQIAPGDEPDWSWRMSTVRDDRPDAARGGPFSDVAEQLKPEYDAAAALAGIERARAAAAIHQKAKSAGYLPLREAVLTNNVGVISFEAGPGGGVVAVHTMYSTSQKGYPEDEPEAELVSARPLGDGAHVSEGKPNTVVRLELTAPAQPPPQPRRALR